MSPEKPSQSQPQREEIAALLEKHPPVEPQPGASHFSLRVIADDHEKEFSLREIPLREIGDSLYDVYLKIFLQNQISQGRIVAGIRVGSSGVAKIMLAPEVTVSKATRSYIEMGRTLVKDSYLTIMPGQICISGRSSLPDNIFNLAVEGLTPDQKPLKVLLKFYPGQNG